MWLKERQEKGIENEYLFVTKRLNTYEPADVSTFNSWADRIGRIIDEDFYGHCVRHAWCTKLAKSGYPKEIIQKIQGWASADMVDIYNDTDAEEELANFFKNLEGDDNDGEQD